MIKTLILIPFLFFLILVQTSFFVHFDLCGTIPNLVLISVVLINFFEDPRKKSGLIIAGVAGFYLDLFSNFQLGISIFLLVLFTLLIKREVKRYKEENILYFIPLLLLIVVLYSIFPVLINSLLDLSLPSFSFNKLKIVEILYNLLVGIIGFFFVKICFGKVLKRS
jgi:rod shape-determining protein MreD